jgi:hypothetical protein
VQKKPYSIRPEFWAETQIRIGINEYTGLLDGNDGKNPSDLNRSPGYREVPDLESSEEMVDAEAFDLICTPDYDGSTVYGMYDAARVLGGGVRGKKLLLRKGLAIGLNYLDQMLTEHFGRAFQLQLVDGYRTGDRQARLFTRMMSEIATDKGLTLSNLTDLQLIEIGRAADLTCSWVRVVDDSANPVIQELQRDSKFVTELQAAIDGSVLKDTLEAAISDYVTISANSKLGRASNVQINARKNAHSGGGAIDVFVQGNLNGTRRPLSHVPFDYASPISATLFLENPDNLGVYLELAKRDPKLAKHLQLLGYERIEDFHRSDWDVMATANRIRYHAFLSAGGSFYDPGDSTEPGECWHYQLGQTVYGLDGKPVVQPLLSSYPDSGNTCHTLLRVPAGPSRIAVRTEPSARKLAEENFGHEV